MSHINSGNHALPLNFFNFKTKRISYLSVKSRKRLIKKQNIGTNGKSSSKSYSLLLSTRKFFGVPATLLCKPYHFQKFHNSLFYLFLFYFLNSETKSYILKNAEIGEKSVVLKDKAHSSISRPSMGFILSPNNDFPLISTEKARYKAQRCSLTTT